MLQSGNKTLVDFPLVYMSKNELKHLTIYVVNTGLEFTMVKNSC